jgi:protein-serine/threonine kinase
MFSTKDAMRGSDTSSINSQPGSGTTTPKQEPKEIATPPKPNSPIRKPSSTDKTATKDKAAPKDKELKPITASAKEKKAAGAISTLRFVVNPDVPGGHEHHLKSAKRQEKLSDMLRSVISGKAKEKGDAHEGEQQLSLMSNWVDQLKSERDSLISDKKGGPNATATLVEKYGKCQEIVGRGAFGIVRISHKRTENGAGEQLYAVKEFRRRPEENEKKYSKRLTAEFCISSSLRHPNVIHTLDLLQDSKGDYCEVMEFCAGGDLYTLVLAAGKLEVTEADCYFKQMMRGVEYMHEMGVAHRDLKPENLLLTTHGSLKITDFGNGECFRMAWESDAHMVSGLCGSAPYIAPEEYVDKEFDARAVDVWATGVIYMAMRTGRHLWRVAKKDEDEFYARYLEGRRDEEGYAPIESLHRVSPYPTPFPNRPTSTNNPQARCRNVIYSILDPNPTRRITASQVLKSEWGREIKLCKAGEEGI